MNTFVIRVFKSGPMERIINELNKEPSSSINYLTNIHTYLRLLPSYVKGNYMTAIEDLYEDFEFEALCMGRWGTNILSKKSILHLQKFELEWKKFRNEVNYGKDGVFVYFDINWHHITTTYLIPFLNNIENDFDKAGVEYISYKKNYRPDTFPPHEDILERGKTLYGLLIKNKIISKH